jgi:Protein of unknown function (DUF3768)
MTEPAGQLELEPAAKREAICRLNDRLRTTGQGGRVVLTAGVAALSRTHIAAILRAVATFDEFRRRQRSAWRARLRVPHDRRPRIIWKIDYHDLGLNWHSLDPAVTTRGWRIAFETRRQGTYV